MYQRIIKQQTQVLVDDLDVIKINSSSSQKSIQGTLYFISLTRSNKLKIKDGLWISRHTRFNQIYEINKNTPPKHCLYSKLISTQMHQILLNTHKYIPSKFASTKMHDS